MSLFESHLEYIFHNTCSLCKYYWTYASMDPKFQIDRGEYHCPNCGARGSVHLEDHRVTIEKENFFSGLTETSTDWFPTGPAEVPNLCLCEGVEEGTPCSCEDL